MQNVAIIRDYNMNLHIQVGGLRFHHSYKEIHYIQLILKGINEFRLLFIEWVKCYDMNNHIWDDWGLLNPPGAIPQSSTDL